MGIVWDRLGPPAAFTVGAGIALLASTLFLVALRTSKGDVIRSE
jgi:hypothetical protein